MLRVWRPLGLAIALHAAGIAASAQTVIVQNAPRGSTVEFVLNGSVAATATTGADGAATLVAGPGGLQDRQAIDAFVWIDECDDARRVLVTSRTVPALPSGACRRSQIEGLFVLQRITTLVVDVGASAPTMRLRQGPAPEEWLRAPSTAGPAPGVSIAPAGLILFGGGGLGSTGGFSTQPCGNVTTCTGDDRTTLLTGGVSFWFSRYVGAEASYMRPERITTQGSGDGFRFESEMDGGLLAFVGKVGIPIGRVRLFGTLGADYHRATFTTSQTIDDKTVTIDGVSQIVPGGEQTFQWRTEGWAPVFGGGAEVWVTRVFGLYGEFGRLGLKGGDVGGGEARTDEIMTSVVIGGRFRIAGP
jgi:hypothetical protein